MGWALPNPLMLLLGSLNVSKLGVFLHFLRRPFMKITDLTSKENQSTKDFFPSSLNLGLQSGLKPR